MDTKTLNLQNKGLDLGAIFTPHEWCKYFIEKFNILEGWINGKSILDPTMGSGNILESLVDLAIANGFQITDLPIHNIFGIELNYEHYNKALKVFKNKYNVDMSNNFLNNDIFECNDIQCDIIFGNPPWKTFNDIDDQYKEYIKPLFYQYELISNPKDLLLGNSRIDISALIIQKSIISNLKQNGIAIFFIPLSLLFNPGANQMFRRFNAKNFDFALESIFDLNNLNVFPNIMTRYGLISLHKSKRTSYPVKYFRYEDQQWNEHQVQPIQNSSDPLIDMANNHTDFQRIEIPETSRPRQGINTCGANEIFFFNSRDKIDENYSILNGEIRLPNKFIFPLITSKNFKGHSCPQRWVMLPYNQLTGKPLSLGEIEQSPALMNYLKLHKERLLNRKGAMLKSFLKKGQWWAMLGVGSYSFVPYKVTWEAYGKKEFNPQIFAGHWQANQSLQAFIPCSDLLMAKSICQKLKNPQVESYLHSFMMDGTMNWAQPGKMRHLFSLIKPYAKPGNLLSLFE